MFKRLLLPLLIVATGFGIMQLLASFKKEQKRMPPRPFVRTVATQKIHYGSIAPTIQSIGRVSALERVSLTPEVSGLILNSSFKLYKGQSFKKGTILFKIDSSQIFFGYSSTVSDLQNALAGMLPELATDQPQALEGWQTFFSQLTVTTLPDLPPPHSDRVKLLATRYGVYKLYYLAQQQRNTLEKHTVYAPFNGTVETTQVFPASMARAGVTVATIVRTDAVEIELALTDQQIPFIKKDMEAAVFIEGTSESRSGKVHRISNVLDERMQTASAFVRLTGSTAENFKSGAYATVRFTGTPLDHAVVIPRKAVHNKKFVYTISADTLAEAEVTIACLSVDSAYLTAGMEEGSTLITEPLQEAVIGMAVQDIATARKRQQAVSGLSGPQKNADKKQPLSVPAPAPLKPGSEKKSRDKR